MSARCWSGMSWEKGFSGWDEIRSVVCEYFFLRQRLERSHTVLGIVQSRALVVVYGHDMRERSVKSVQLWVSMINSRSCQSQVGGRKDASTRLNVSPRANCDSPIASNIRTRNLFATRLYAAPPGTPAAFKSPRSQGVPNSKLYLKDL